MAEVNFTSANAVWVAGPDRIFFVTTSPKLF